MSTNLDKWSDEQCRYFFQLYAEEREKGNKQKSGMNQTGKSTIIKKFAERFGKTHIWDKFKNKYDTSRRVYIKWKRLVQNRTGLGYDSMGRLDMSSSWWNDREAEWPGAIWCKNNLACNLDLFHEEFGAISVTGAEGWSAQQGEASLDSRVAAENEADSDSVDKDASVTMTETVGETQSKGGSSKSKKKKGRR